MDSFYRHLREEGISNLAVIGNSRPLTSIPRWQYLETELVPSYSKASSDNEGFSTPSPANSQTEGSISKNKIVHANVRVLGVNLNSCSLS